MRTILIAAALAGCATIDETERTARGVTEHYACTAQLTCERTPIGTVIDDIACTADDGRAYDATLAQCDALAVTECAGFRYWRCDVECERTADPTPCIP
jgi:hypothetical protein